MKLIVIRTTGRVGLEFIKMTVDQMYKAAAFIHISEKLQTITRVRTKRDVFDEVVVVEVIRRQGAAISCNSSTEVPDKHTSIQCMGKIVEME